MVDLVGEPTTGVALRAVREMLGMDVAYVSEIVGDDMILRELEGDPGLLDQFIDELETPALRPPPPG
jgi:hypothetical protein